MPEGWEWDETLFLGSAPYYRQGRPPYAPALAETLRDAVPLNAGSRVLDVGCGPGVIGLEVAPFVAEVVGVDPDAGMLAAAQQAAVARGIGNARWVRARAEELPAALERCSMEEIPAGLGVFPTENLTAGRRPRHADGAPVALGGIDAEDGPEELGPLHASKPPRTMGGFDEEDSPELGALRTATLLTSVDLFDAAIFGQSFHWVDQPLVAATMRAMLGPGGAFIHVADHKAPLPNGGPLPAPPPPYAAIRALTQAWLGPVARAGQGTLPHGSPGGEAEVLAAAGFAGPDRWLLPPAGPLLRDEDDVVAWVWSLSGSTPHLFGERRAAFETELRGVLRAASPAGRFAEWLPATEVRVWRNPGAAGLTLGDEA